MFKTLLAIPSLILGIWNAFKELVALYKKTIIEGEYAKDISSIDAAFARPRVQDVSTRVEGEPDPEAYGPI